MKDLSEPGALSHRCVQVFLIPARTERACRRGVAAPWKIRLAGAVGKGGSRAWFPQGDGTGRRRAGKEYGGTSEAPIKAPQPSGCDVWGTDPMESALYVVGA